MQRQYKGLLLSWTVTWSRVALCLACACVAVSRAQATVVRFQTSSGNIDVRLYDAATPLSVANFLNYANSNRYDGTFIHRVPQRSGGGGTSNFVVQGGGFALNDSIFAATPIVTDPPVLNEPGISNLRGTLALAKSVLPNSATSQWFFNIGNNSFLDSPASGAFTVFGRVLGSGMSVVDSINNLAVINAAAAQDQGGEDYDEVPVYDLHKVITQQDVRNEDAVMMLDISPRDLPAGDYNFDGSVDLADLVVWQADYGSTTKAEADGNGNGIVDDADYDIWRAAVPEPSSVSLAGVMAIVLLWRRPKKHGNPAASAESKCSRRSALTT